MKNRILSIVFSILFVSAILWLIMKGAKPEILPVGSKMPHISIITVNGTDSLISNNKQKTAIVFFNEKCSHCQYELNILNQNIKKFSATKLYLITTKKDYLTSDNIKTFTNLLEAENVTFGIADEDEYYKKYGFTGTPSFCFFDENCILTNKLTGETKLARILKELDVKKGLVSVLEKDSTGIKHGNEK